MLLLENLVDLLCQDLVFLLFTVEVFGPFRCIVDDFGNLEGDEEHEILHELIKGYGDNFNIMERKLHNNTFVWSTES